MLLRWTKQITLIATLIVALSLLLSGIQQVLVPKPRRTAEFLRVWHRNGDIRYRTYGFVDNSGRWAISPKYDLASEFSDGLALVLSRHGYAYITPDGSIALDEIHLKSGGSIPSSQWDSAGDFDEGHAAIVVAGKVHLMDRAGRETGSVNGDIHEMLGPGLFPLSAHFSEGLAVVKDGTQSGAVNREGEWVIRPHHDVLREFVDGLAIAARGQGDAAVFGVIDQADRTVLSFEWEWMQRAGQDSFVVVKKGRYGIVDRNGNWPVPLSESVIISLGNDMACMQGSTNAVIDIKGAIKFPFKWQEMGGYAEGLSDVWSPAEAGYIDMSGHLVVKLPTRLSALFPFKHGLADVWTGIDKRGHGLVDRTGKIVIWDADEEF
jgi:hypothetical protein